MSDAPTTGLLLPRCRSCQRFFWYPRVRCPSCGSRDVERVESPGVGTVYSYSSLRAGKNATGDQVLAYVRLAEGPLVLTTLTGVEPEAAQVGMPVVALRRADDEPVRFTRLADAPTAPTG